MMMAVNPQPNYSSMYLTRFQLLNSLSRLMMTMELISLILEWRMEKQMYHTPLMEEIHMILMEQWVIRAI